MAAPGPQRRRDLRRRRSRRSRSATTAPGPTTCCPPAAAPGTRRAVGADVPARHPRRRVRRGGAARGRAATSSRSPTPRTCPRTARPSRSRFRGREPHDRPATTLPLPRRPARAARPYGAPQLDVPVRLNTNENPYPLPRAVVADDRRGAARRGRRRPQPLPGPGRARAARGPRRLPRPRARRRRSVWAANGSNEVMQQLLQAFGGPGRTALGFAPVVLDAPAASPPAPAPRWIGRRRATPTSALDPPRRPPRRSASTQPDVVFLCSPNNPTGTALPTRPWSRPCCDAAPGMVVVDEAYAEFARAGTPQRAGAAAAATRGWSSPGR